MEPQIDSPMVAEPVLPPVKKIRSREQRWARTVIVVLTIVIAFLAWTCYDTREQMAAMRTDLSKRFAEGDSVARDAHLLSRQNQDNIEQIQSRLGSLDAKQQEAQGQYAALESMYMEFSRARDERSLAEIEQALNIAAQHLQLAGNVPAAISALQAADSQLAVMDQARFLPLRKLIARDIERLKTLPLADATSMSLQLETLMGRIDTLPLGFERTVPTTKTSANAAIQRPAKVSKGGKKAQSTPAEAVQSSPSSVVAGPSAAVRFFSDIWDDFRELIRIERLDRPDPALLAPSQAAFLRENLRLRLLSARLALMQRDGRLFSEDVHQARVWLERYFDTQSKPVADLIADLKQMESAQLSMALPSLDETTSALRSLKLGGKR